MRFPSLKRNIRELLILLAIIFITLAISMLYPFYRGVHEGLTSTELDSSGPIRKALLKYTNKVESNCQQMINSISSLTGLEQTETLSINTIIGNTNFTNTSKFQQIISLNSKNEELTDALNTIQGKNFAALLKLFQSLPTTTSDEAFNKKVTQQISSINKMLNSSDMTSPFYTINSYVENSPATA
jgi:uncharacterized membrane protein YfhO